MLSNCSQLDALPPIRSVELSLPTARRVKVGSTPTPVTIAQFECHNEWKEKGNKMLTQVSKQLPDANIFSFNSFYALATEEIDLSPRNAYHLAAHKQVSLTRVGSYTYRAEVTMWWILTTIGGCFCGRRAQELAQWDFNRYWWPKPIFYVVLRNNGKVIYGTIQTRNMHSKFAEDFHLQLERCAPVKRKILVKRLYRFCLSIKYHQNYLAHMILYLLLRCAVNQLWEVLSDVN